eukprot:gene4748-4998_t
MNMVCTALLVDAETGCWVQFQRQVRLLKLDVLALYYAVHDPRTPLISKLLPWLVLSYALSPLDLIPDFIPILGILDDMLLLPLGLWISYKLIPAQVMQDCRHKAATEPLLLHRNWLVAVLVFLLWLSALLLLVHWLVVAEGSGATVKEYEWAVLAGIAGAAAVLFALWIISRIRYETRKRDEVTGRGPCAAERQPPGGPGSGSSGGGGGCVCPMIYKPVCTTAGNTRGNDCEAGCRGEKVQYLGECRRPPGAAGSGAGGAAAGSSNKSSVLPSPGAVKGPSVIVNEAAAVPKPPMRDGCVCAAVYAPVCGDDSNTYSNSCDAGCRGVKVKSQGVCGSSDDGGSSSSIEEDEGAAPAGLPPAVGEACAACPTELNPYCVDSSPWGPRTFANCCFVKCNGIPVLSNVLHPGVCKYQCVEKCDRELERPLCCQGRTYKNGCFALCNKEDTSRCSLGRCSSVAGVGSGVGCLLGPCAVKCNGYAYEDPVCGSDGHTYPSRCHLLCHQEVAIVAQGKCGTCTGPRNSTGSPTAAAAVAGGGGGEGVFPYCFSNDTLGLAPVCGKDNVTYRNKLAAAAAGITEMSNGSCANMCGER